jgi:hypothetical protein
LHPVNHGGRGSRYSGPLRDVPGVQLIGAAGEQMSPFLDVVLCTQALGSLVNDE